MGDELKQIKVETARIRLEREKLAYQDEVNKRAAKQRVTNVAENVLKTTQEVGGVAVGVSLKATIWTLRKLAWVALAFALTYLFLYFYALYKLGSVTIDRFHSYLAYWMGSGGFLILLAAPFIGPWLLNLMAGTGQVKEHSMLDPANLRTNAVLGSQHIDINTELALERQTKENAIAAEKLRESKAKEWQTNPWLKFASLLGRAIQVAAVVLLVYAIVRYQLR